MTPAATELRAPDRAYGRARTPPATAYVLCVLTVLIGLMTVDLVASHQYGWRVPIWREFGYWLGSLAAFIPGGEGDQVANPILMVVVPALLIAPVGLRRVDLGLGPFRRDGRRTALIWLGIATAIVLAVIAFRLDAPGHVLQRMVTNLTTNGFSEEILFRGLLLGALVPVLGALRANIVQAAAFGCVHLGLDLRLAHGNWALASAMALGLQGVVALGFGIITLRTGNVVVPSLLHDALDTLPI